MTTEHKWTEDDDLIAYALFRCDSKTSGLSRRDLALALGMPLKSISAKISNYKALDGQGSFDGWSKQAEATFEKYKDMTDTQVIEAAIDAMQRVLGRLQDEANRTE